MLYKICFYFTILIVLFTPDVELRLPIIKRRNEEKAISDVIQNITRVNNVLEDLIKNYEKLKTMYKSEETIKDYSSDAEMDEVYKQKNQLRARSSASTTTRNPNGLATSAFYSEEKAHVETDTDNNNDSDLENNKPDAVQPKTDKQNNDTPIYNNPQNNEVVIKLSNNKVLEKEREKMPQVEFLVQGGNPNNEVAERSTTKTEAKAGQGEYSKNIYVLKPWTPGDKPTTNETTVIIKKQNVAVTQSKVPAEQGRMKLVSRPRNEVGGENSQPQRVSNSAESTFAGNSGSFTDDGTEEENQNQDEGYSKNQQSFDADKYESNRNEPDKLVSTGYDTKKPPTNNGQFRTLKKVIKAEEFSYDKIWDEVLHKPLKVDVQKEIVYFKQPKIYFRNQITPETTWKYKEVTLEPSVSMEKPRIQTTKKRVHTTPGHTAQSLEDEKTIMKEQFKTRILRKAYGDACLKVVVKKCYKACKASTKSACKKYNCKSNFKAAFERSAKTNCIKEFRETPPVRSRTNYGPYDTQFQDITRNGYLAAACLPTRTETKPNSSLSKTENQLNILRDRFERECQKVSSDKCTNACAHSFDEACANEDCSGGKLSSFKKSCKKECKNAYRGSSSSHKKHSKSGSCESKSGSGSDSGSGSGSCSGSESDFDFDITTKKEEVKKKIVISRAQVLNRTNIARQAMLQLRAKLGV